MSYPEFGTQLPAGHTVVRLRGPASLFERFVPPVLKTIIPSRKGTRDYLRRKQS